MSRALRIQFITPLFSAGAVPSSPEIRAASIRGQLHWWFRAVHPDPRTCFEDEREIFGGIKVNTSAHRSSDRASRLVVRVSEIDGQVGNEATLPHKSGGQAAPKPCLLPGASFLLHLAWRRGEPTGRPRKVFEDAFSAWLAYGGLGLRSTRGAGALHAQEWVHPYWIAAPIGGQRIGQLAVACLDQRYRSSEDARRAITDTIGGPFQGGESGDDLRRLRNPLGGVGRDLAGSQPRKTSPLRLTVRFVDSDYVIFAAWDCRIAVTGNRPGDLEGAIAALRRAGKPLGDLLFRSALLRFAT